MNQPITLRSWTTTLVPDLDEIDNSNPDAVLLDDNLVAIVEDTSTSHEVARALEGLGVADTAITTIVYGDRGRHDERTVDPERITDHAARRAGGGAGIGSIVGAIVIGVGAYLVSDDGTTAMAAALGGALFGAFAGGVWSFVIGTGQTDAYLDTFVDPAKADVTLITVHATDTELVAAAIDSLTSLGDVRLVRVGPDGRSTDGS